MVLKLNKILRINKMEMGKNFMKLWIKFLSCRTSRGLEKAAFPKVFRELYGALKFMRPSGHRLASPKRNLEDDRVG